MLINKNVENIPFLILNRVHVTNMKPTVSFG